MTKPRLAVGIDVGSNRTRCAICIVEDGELRFAGYGDAHSRGWTKGRIADQNEISESIRLAVTEAERLAQISVDGAVVGIGGSSA